MNVNEHRSVPDLFSDLLNQLTALFRTEARLARVEMSEKLSKAGAGLGMIVFAAVLAIPAMVILLQAAVAALIENGLQPHWSALIVGGATLLIGIVLALAGFKSLNPRKLMPQKTIDQLQSDASMARRQAR